MRVSFNGISLSREHVCAKVSNLTLESRIPYPHRWRCDFPVPTSHLPSLLDILGMKQEEEEHEACEVPKGSRKAKEPRLTSPNATPHQYVSDLPKGAKSSHTKQ